MAAPTAVDKTMSKMTDNFVYPVYTTNQGSELESGELQDFVVDFLEKEIGSDLKSLKNVGKLLEELREENSVLEEQVN